MNRTQKVITENFNTYKVEQIDKYIENGGFQGLKNALEKGKDFIIDELNISGLRGRGGAAYPTGKKWNGGRKNHADVKYVLCNADEGEPATFKDRELLLRDPYKVLEGLAISGYTFGAKEGFIYIREEYEFLHDKIRKAIKLAEENGYLGKNILGTGFDFSIKVFSGAGAYVCGEGSALIESMEGKAGRPRMKPPRIGVAGYMGKPTQSNNVETLAIVATVLKMGAANYAKYGTEKSIGTKMISLCGNVKKPGTYEIPFGMSLREIIYDIGGGIVGDKDIKFLQLGGVSGPLMPKKYIDTKYTYEDLDAEGFGIGSGAILVADETKSVIKFLESVSYFFFHESCGKCTPCREGKRQMKKLLNKMAVGTATTKDLKNIEKISKIMKDASFCGLGQTASTAMLTAIKYFSPELCSSIDEIQAL